MSDPIARLEELMARHAAACEDEDSRAHIAISREIDGVLRSAAPALLAVAKAAREVDRCQNHSEMLSPLARLEEALQRLGQPEGEG